ncbi:MAG: flagellar basal body P-ring formation protein FlgA [Verrucomicrobia bacterium]|nr:flagellar basal body P-ring formation protein FlgA [Verrucomicrobiota bacterium]
MKRFLRQLLHRSGFMLALAFPLAGQTASFSLLPGATVTGDGVFLQQLVSADDGSPQPHLRVTDAPAVGQSLVLTRDQITALLQKSAPGFTATNWTGAAQARITRRTRLLGESELKELLTDVLQREHVRQRGELELVFARAWTAAIVPDEPFTLKLLDLPTSGVGPNMIVRFELRGTRETFGTWSAITQARVWREVLVAGALLKRGQPLTDSDVVRERRDLILSREALDALPRVETSLELVENVPAGVPLTARSFRVRPLVLRGQTLEALVQDGALQISTKVELLEDGLSGQFVRVRNPLSRREFRGKVQNENTILVQL